MFSVPPYFRQAEFIISAVTKAQWPTAKPEVAFVGRSNVGKSSLINHLLGRRGLAKTSNTPGKTKMLNFFRLGEAAQLVDLPGYGYAKTARQEKGGWQAPIETYLLERSSLRLILFLVDARHPPSKLDLAFLDWARHHNLPLLVILTKADKIPTTKRKKHTQEVARLLGVERFVLYSTLKNLGRSEVARCIHEALVDGVN